ncbi:VirB4 family type IV secretion/conjugal transfer ATPase [Helicobacter pylori]|uniref:VirB4 family type IV secretion/conjugal transfer ATPase n=1 Tax=Helicobacter pylori TaxID=210 RepID=UPI0018D15049|nr:VirB4 family type IV secretion/conjugal transfer ATPase [Helicobacter pylori]MBH0303840.1 VirB4 family type IV secretion/conjugal transfer ATPase [Helicobacter pylori]
MLENAFKYCKEKAIELLTGFVPKTYSMAQECNILGLYDDTFIITKQENLVGIISLQGLSYSNLMQKDLEGYFDTRQNVLNTISKDIQLRIVAKRRKEFINQSPNIDNPYAKAIITQFENKEIYKTEYFLVFESITSNVKSFFEKKKLEMTTSINEELEESSKENENNSNETHSNTSSKKDKKNKFKKKTTFSATSKRALLIQTIERVKNALREFKPTLLNSKEVLNFYAEYINGKYIAFNPKLKRQDYFVIEFQNQSTFCACVGIKNYESEEISSLPISTLLHTQIELDLIFHIRSLGQFESLNFLKTKKKLTLSKMVKNDIDDYIELVQANRLSMQECALNLVIRAKSKAKLDKSLKEILSLLNNAGLGSVTETIGLKPSYFSFFPNNANINPRMRHQTSQVIASLILFEKNNIGFRANSWGDMPLSVFKNLDYSPYLFNFHNQEVKHKGVLAHNVARVVGHTMIIGATGAGKTTLISYLMMSALKYSNIDILALDRLNGLYSFTKYFDGIYNQGENFHINPFSLEDSATNRAFLLHFYAQMAKVDSYDDHKDKVEDKTALINAIDTMYRNYNDEVKQAKFSNQELPLPFDLKDYLKSSLFSSRMDSLDFKTRISTINTDSILHNDDDAGLLAYYVFHKMIDRALKINRGFLCFIDEFKSYAQNEMMNKKINEIITQARKANGVIVLALQDINQLTEVRNAQSFIKNMGQLILYPQRNIDTKDLNDKFGIRLSDTEKHFLENTAVNEYKVLLKNMNDGSSNIIDVSLSSLGNYLQIFSSNSSMVEHIDNLIKHYPKTWREVFVSNKHENFDDKKHLEKVLK